MGGSGEGEGGRIPAQANASNQAAPRACEIKNNCWWYHRKVTQNSLDLPQSVELSPWEISFL